MDYQKILEDIYQEILPFADKGAQADYIPALAKVNPDQFGIALKTASGESYSYMQAQTRFSIQSISKVFALAMALSLEGEDLWKIVGKEPSGTAFNSLVQLEVEKGKPRNPFINAGALVIADLLMSRLDDPDLNAAIINLLKHHGRIQNNIEDVLMFYFRMCSVEMSCEELAQAFLAFTNCKTFDFGGYKLSSSKIKRLNAVMQTCGFYDEAGEFSYLVVLPGKSGVGGGIVAVHPLHYSVAVWSPRLNSKGNSVMGMKALELLTTYTHESIF